MRTPWRFLADMVSRKPSMQATTEIDAQEIKAIEYRPAEQEIIPPVEVEVPSVEAEPVTAAGGQLADNVDAAVSVTEETTSTSEALVNGPLSSAAHQEEVTALDTIQRDERIEVVVVDAEQADSVETNVEPPKRARRRDTAANSMAASPVSTTDVPRYSPSLYNEMLSLDDEIQQLRRELARKLTAQNAQLRKMLDRYDRR